MSTIVILNMNIGIAVTTRNRNDIAKECLDNIIKFSIFSRLVVIDDASEIPFIDSRCEIKRFDTQQGIAKAKNACIRLLDNCEHIFLFDDDCWPIKSGWEKHYIDSANFFNQKAMCYTWDKLLNGDYPIEGSCFAPIHYENPTFNSIEDMILNMKKISQIKGLKFHENGRGVMMYLTRECIDTIGGFSEKFGIYGGEHVDYFVRANNTNLTSNLNPDIIDSDEYFRSLDREEGHITSSVHEKATCDISSLLMERINSIEKVNL